MLQMERIAQILAKATMDAAAQTSFILCSEKEGLVWQSNPEARFRAASLIKLLIASAVREGVLTGKWRWEDCLDIPADVHAGGTGVLSGLHITSARLDDLVFMMLSLSDNTATNLLIRELGIESVNRHAARTGLTITRLERRMLDSEAVEAGKENYTCARDVAVLLNDLVGEEDPIVRGLARQQDASMLGALETAGPFMHKTGSIPGVRHDAGVLETDNDRFVVVSLWESTGDEWGGRAMFGGAGNEYQARIGRAIARIVGGMN